MKKSICSGYLIGLSSYIYSTCENKIIGSILFGLGLLTICTFKLNLFTGQIGELRIKNSRRFCKLILVFIFNAIGMAIAVGLFKFLPHIAVAGIVCGSLMQIGVSLYFYHPWATVMCVAAFLLSGSNHCIAMLYNFDPMSVDYLWSLFIAIIGNAVGAKIVAILGVTRKEHTSEGL